MSREKQVSTGERVVLCESVECAFAGNEVGGVMRVIEGLPSRVWYICEADIIVLDRRVKFGKVCARFAKKTKGG